MSSDDQAWLDGLAGRDDDSDAAREGAALRRAMQKRVVAKMPEMSTSAKREAALIAKARADSDPTVVEDPPARAATRADRGSFWSRLTAPGYRPAWAGAALAIVISLGLFFGLPEKNALRGPAGAEILIEAEDPVALRLAITEALYDIGVDARISSMLGDEIVTAELPQPVSAPVRDVLVRFQIPVPEDGELIVRITASRQ